MIALRNAFCRATAIFNERGIKYPARLMRGFERTSKGSSCTIGIVANRSLAKRFEHGHRTLCPAHKRCASEGTGGGAGPFLFAARQGLSVQRTQLAWKGSAHVRRTLLVLELARSLGLRGQLKNRSLLSLTEERQEYDLTIWKFQSIVVRGDLLLVDLSEDRRLVLHYFFAPSEQTSRLTGYFVRKG
jgi:hypothetical protein